MPGGPEALIVVAEDLGAGLADEGERPDRPARGSQRRADQLWSSGRGRVSLRRRCAGVLGSEGRQGRARQGRSVVRWVTVETESGPRACGVWQGQYVDVNAADPEAPATVRELVAL